MRWRLPQICPQCQVKWHGRPADFRRHLLQCGSGHSQRHVSRLSPALKRQRLAECRQAAQDAEAQAAGKPAQQPDEGELAELPAENTSTANELSS